MPDCWDTIPGTCRGLPDNAIRVCCRTWVWPEKPIGTNWRRGSNVRPSGGIIVASCWNGSVDIVVDVFADLLKNLNYFQVMEVPILVGISRKSMFYKLLGTTPDEALNATTAAHMVALKNGASILRVHDVAAAREVIQLWKLLET